jgi:hypothetical protein
VRCQKKVIFFFKIIFCSENNIGILGQKWGQINDLYKNAKNTLCVAKKRVPFQKNL